MCRRLILTRDLIIGGGKKRLWTIPQRAGGTQCRLCVYERVVMAVLSPNKIYFGNRTELIWGAVGDLCWQDMEEKVLIMEQSLSSCQILYIQDGGQSGKYRRILLRNWRKATDPWHHGCSELSMVLSLHYHYEYLSGLSIIIPTQCFIYVMGESLIWSRYISLSGP